MKCQMYFHESLKKTTCEKLLSILEISSDTLRRTKTHKQLKRQQGYIKIITVSDHNRKENQGTFSQTREKSTLPRMLLMH